MYGLINKSIEIFVTETYGHKAWHMVMEQADLGFTQFEAMLPYEAPLTDAVLAAMEAVLRRSIPSMLEDLGTFLVTSPSLPALRRLLRFGGTTYIDFLYSLEDLPDRVRLAVPYLHLPPLDLQEDRTGRLQLRCHTGLPGYGHVMLGVLRAMADEYGALALLDVQAHVSGGDVITIQVVQDSYAKGNAFALGGMPA